MQLPTKLSITYIQRHYTQKPLDFSSLLQHLCTVTHLDELIYIFHHLPLFTETTLITDINIFKSPIQPLWEDPKNIAGGKYIIKLKKCVGQRLFERLVISFAICDDNINGIVASIRSSQVILSVWCDTTQNNLDFVKRVRKMLDIGYEIPIEYKDNDESLKDNSSFRNTAVFGKRDSIDVGIETRIEGMSLEKKGKKGKKVLMEALKEKEEQIKKEVVIEGVIENVKYKEGTNNEQNKKEVLKEEEIDCEDKKFKEGTKDEHGKKVKQFSKEEDKTNRKEGTKDERSKKGKQVLKVGEKMRRKEEANNEQNKKEKQTLDDGEKMRLKEETNNDENKKEMFKEGEIDSGKMSRKEGTDKIVVDGEEDGEKTELQNELKKIRSKHIVANSIVTAFRRENKQKAQNEFSRNGSSFGQNRNKEEKNAKNKQTQCIEKDEEKKADDTCEEKELKWQTYKPFLTKNKGGSQYRSKNKKS